MTERLIDAVCPHCGRVGTTVRVVLNEDGFTKLSRRCTDCGGECVHTFDHDWLADAKNKKLRAENERLQKRDAEWTEKAAAWLSSAEAAQRLDGYRELAARVNELTLQRDEAVTLLAEWCHAVDGGASWDDWDNHYKQARWGKGILRSLIDAEIAKLEGESNA